MTDFTNTPELSEITEPAISYSTCYQQCFLSDNMELMKTIESNTIDLIYCDILYGTGRKFKDYQDLKPNRNEIENHYIPRLKEMHRILKPTGSIYLQMDYKISHWIRLIFEDIGLTLQNEITWQYGLGNNNTKRNWQNKHDTILFATKTKDYKWNDMRGEVTPQMKAKYCHKDEQGNFMMSYGKKYYLKGGKRIGNVWDFPNLSATDSERLGYDTQKPKVLIEQIIKSCTNENDLVADFYAGSFTTAEVCKDLNRNFIGCDINPLALEISKQRLA